MHRATTVTETYVEHLNHLFLITEEKDASVVTGDVLDLCNNGVDDAGFELIALIFSVGPASSVKHISLQ
jgi:hypothetical protein